MKINYFNICKLDKTPICDLADNSSFRVSNVQSENSINEVTTLSFDYPVKSPKFKYIACENLVYFDDEYYFIKTPEFHRDSDGKLYVHVECKHLSDTLASQLISIEEITPLNVVNLMKVALQYDSNDNPTLGWKVGNVTVDRVACRGLEANETSPFSILLTIAEKYSGVLVFDSKTMEVNMYPAEDQTHPKLDLQVSKNLKEIQIKYDTTEMVTRMYGYGATDENTNTELDFMSVSPDGLPYIENYNYFVSKGYSLEYIKANPALFVRTNIFRDDNIVDAQDLYDSTLNELAKASRPSVTIEVTGLDMSMAKGVVESNTINLNNNPYSLEIGDSVRVLDKDINVDYICNVTKRTIDYENPHLLTISLTNNVEYKDVLSELYGNVSNMSTVVSSGGKLHGNKIDSINVGQISDIDVYYLTADQIAAKYATIDNLKAEYLTAEFIKATYLDAESIASTYATIGSLQAVEAKIEKLNADEINAKLANLDQVIADNANIKKLLATDAEIKDLQAQDVTIAGLLKSANAEIESLKSTSITAGEFNAYKATIEKLFAAYASIEYLEANYINANTIETNYAKITELDAVRGNFDTLKASLADVEKLVADKADIKDLNAVTANIDTINTNLANVEKLVAKKVDADYVQAEIVKANKVVTDQLDAINATIENLDAKYATIDQLNAAKANLEDLIAKKASVDDLDATKASIGELDAQLANINSIMAGNVGTGLLQTIHLTASNVVMDNAIIKSANIKDLDVSKLNAGTISTDKFTIKSDDGGIQIVGSTQQFTDKNGKVRLQVGKDAKGDFNFIVFGEDGSTAIYDQNGITKKAVPDGLIVDQMVADDAGIQASKVKYIDEDGDKTLQTVVESQQGKITSLIKETEIIKEDFNNLQIGGRNLFLNSGDLSKVTWGASGGGTYIIAYEKDNNVPSKDVRKMTWSAPPTQGVYFAGANYYNAGIKKGDIVTVSVWCKCSSNKTIGKLTCEFLKVTSSTIPNLSTSWQKYVVTGVANKDVIKSNEGSIGITFYYGSNINAGDSLCISSPKVELGNRPTDWSPAPEDLEKTVTTLSDKYNETVKTVDSNTTTIANVKTTVDGHTNSISSMNSSISQIKQTADGVSTTVSQNKSNWDSASDKATTALSTANQTADKFTWLVKSGTSSTNFTLTDRTADLIAGQINLRGLVKFTGLTSSTQRALSNGKCLNIDETFLTGTNSVIRYGNGIDTTTYPNANVVTRIDKISDCPTSSPYCLKISLGNGAFTGLSGFIQRVDSRANAVFVQRFIAKLPVGYQFYRNSNTMGTGYVDEFITDVVGTGKFTEYIRVTRCGSSGEFYSGGHVYVKPISSSTTAPTDANPVVFYLASCATYDVTETNDINAWGLEDVPTNNNVTTINGGFIKTKSITVSQLDVENILAKNGTFMNAINAQEINADRITSGKVTSKFLDTYGLKVLDSSSNIETFSIATNGQVMLRGSVESYDYVTGKSGWSINREGSAEFNDVVVRGSVITGDAGIVSSGGTGENLQKNTSFYDGMNGWDCDKNLWVVDPTFKYNGVNTAKFIRQGIMGDSPLNIRTPNGTIPATQGETFTAQVMFYTNDYNAQVIDKDARLRMIFRDDSNRNISEKLLYVPWVNKQWIKCEVTGTAPSGTTNVLLCITTSRNGVYWIAQPKIERGSSSTPWSLSPNDKGQMPRIWAGATYENREYAPFVVYNDGTMRATKGTFGGVFTGDIQIGNVSITDPNSSAGDDATITVVNGNNGVRAVQLTDTNKSSFAQNLIVTDNFYNEQVKVNQNGIINVKEQVVVGDVDGSANEKTVVGSNYLQFNNGTLENANSGLVVNNASNFDVGTVSNSTSLNIYGDANVRSILKVYKEINFNDNVKCTCSSDGIDFNFYEGVGIVERPTYTVTWNTQGGSSIADSKVIEGNTVTKPTNPTFSDGASFLGWYKDKACTSEWNFNYPINGNTTLYAKWEEPSMPTLNSSNTVKYSSCNYIITDGTKTANDWVIAFSGTVKGRVSYRWYIDLYYYNDQGGEVSSYIERSDVLSSATGNTIKGSTIGDALSWDKNYRLSGRCNVTITLGNVTKTYSYSGFESACVYFV